MTSLDKDITRYLIEHSNKILDYIFTFIAHLGDMMLVWIVITLLLLYKNKDWFMTKYYVITFSLSFLINNVAIKNLVERPRPFITDPSIIPLVNEISYSFPSGHAASSFVAATFLAHYYPNYRILFFLLAGLIAFARVYVRVHYLSDTLAGALFGSIIAIICYKIIDKKFLGELKK